MRNTVKNKGFSLIELAVVLVIIGVAFGGFISTLSSRIEQSKREQTTQQLHTIKKALLGFAMANGRLPCPAIATSDGLEAPVGGGDCTSNRGLVPNATLGLSGGVNDDNLLLDSWNNPIRYSVSNTTSSTSHPDHSALTTVGKIKNSWQVRQLADLVVCSASAGAYDDDIDDCASPLSKRTSSAPFVLLSLGANATRALTTISASSDEDENSGEQLLSANAAGENVNYGISSDKVFVSRDYGEAGSSGGQFNDLIMWGSLYELYAVMLEAGQLP